MKKQLLQLGILFGLLAAVLLLGGIIEGGLALPAGVCTLAVACAAVYGMATALSKCEARSETHPAQLNQHAAKIDHTVAPANAACTQRQSSAAGHAKGLRVA